MPLEKMCDKYYNFSEEKKNKKCQNAPGQYRNLSEKKGVNMVVNHIKPCRGWEAKVSWVYK